MKRALPIFAVLAVLLAAIALANPFFLEPAGFLAFVKRAAPLVILAAGQYFVIVSGEFDLSVGSLVTVEVVVAARLIDGNEAATWPVLALVVVIGLLVGLVNGAVTTLLRVPSFITTLGMMLVLSGAVFLWTGGAPRGALSQAFRVFGRDTLWSVLILAAVGAAAVLLMRADVGRTLIATGDNARTAALSGVRVTRVKIFAFAVSGLAAAVAGVLLGGFAGVSAQVGQGLEFSAITAVVLGGVALGGGRGSVVAAMAGAFTLEALFTLLNLYGISGALEFTVQGVIIIAAVAAGAVRLPFSLTFRNTPRNTPRKFKGDAHVAS
ncbi:ABC transporter permease [Nonomuraea sp. NPDC004354]